MSLLSLEARAPKDLKINIVSAGCHENANGKRPKGAILSHASNTKASSTSVRSLGRMITLASLPQGTGAARNKAQDRAHGIHKTIEYRANHKLLRV